jgi:hypothetical protein
MDYDPNNSFHRKALALDLKATLLGLGLVPQERTGPREMVFCRPSSRLTRTQLQVFTSIVDDEVRDLGSDSIKVCVTYDRTDGGTRGILKEARVFRTGQIEEIPERLVNRIHAAIKELKALRSCDRCGSPMLVAKSGKPYCADACWNHKGS